MANVLTFTEQFDNAAWTRDAGCDVTANTQAAPAFAGAMAGMADTLTDSSTSLSTACYQTVSKGGSDANDWTVSIYVRKEVSVTTVPEFTMQFRDGGTLLIRGTRLDPVSGATGNAGQTVAPAAMGVDDVDTNWWRLWMRHADNNTGNANIRLVIFPAMTTIVTAGNNGTVTGSIVVWGANITKTSTVQAYEPDPIYAPSAITDLSAIAVSATNVDLTWTPADGADSHRIERRIALP